MRENGGPTVWFVIIVISIIIIINFAQKLA